MLRAGDLRRKVTFTALQRAKNDMGAFDTVPTVVATPYAKIEGLDGREVMMGRAFEGIQSYRITVRWNAALLSADAALTATLDDGKALNVRSVMDPDGRRERLMILADSGSVGGEA